MTRLSLIVTAAALALGAGAAVSSASAAQSSACHGGYRMGPNQVFVRCDSQAMLTTPMAGSTDRAVASGVSRGAAPAPSVMVGAPADCHPGGYWVRDMAAGDGTFMQACPR